MTDTDTSMQTDWTLVHILVGRIALDVQDTWTVSEHIDKLGLPERVSDRFRAAAADALMMHVSDLDRIHTSLGWHHDQIIENLRQWLREHDPRDSDDPGEDGFVAIQGWGRARNIDRVPYKEGL